MAASLGSSVRRQLERCARVSFYYNESVALFLDRKACGRERTGDIDVDCAAGVLVRFFDRTAANKCRVGGRAVRW
jgi:hypothetical protein